MTDRPAVAPDHAAAAGRAARAPSTGLPLAASLSARLLFLTIGFVMLAEVLIFAPSIARFRVDYLHEKLSQAHLVLTALEVSGGVIDPELRDRFLDQAGMLGMTLTREGLPPRTLAPRIPPTIPVTYDLRENSELELIADAFDVLLRSGNPVFAVMDFSRNDPSVVIEAVLEEQPMRRQMRAYAIRVFALSIFISVSTAALVYGAIQWLAVRPLRRLTASMIAFREAPENQARIIVPEPRGDEVGIAEQALAEMQAQLRQSLTQKERLAALGRAVTRMSHDLKNILATAMLESDRLGASQDAETRRITAGIVRAIDRAVALSRSTLKFAQEGLPDVRRRRVQLALLLDDIVTTLQPAIRECRINVEVATDQVVTVDPDLLQRALENLLRNAAEAGATEIRVAYEPPALVRVVDNGPGLPRRALDNLFVPFAGSARADGTGLGLPIARELLRAQGGDVFLERTQPGETIFGLRLPA